MRSRITVITTCAIVQTLPRTILCEAAIRAEVSSLLKAEIEATPGFVRRLLRPRATKDILSGSLLDSIDVNEAEMRVEFVGACRQYAGELAVND